MGIYYKKTEQIGKISKEENVRWEFIIRRLSKLGKCQRKRTCQLGNCKLKKMSEEEKANGENVEGKVSN